MTSGERYELGRKAYEAYVDAAYPRTAAPWWHLPQSVHDQWVAAAMAVLGVVT